LQALKLEEVHLNDYRNFGVVEHNLDECTKEAYNRNGLHSSLGYLRLLEFEAIHPSKARKYLGG
jgi:hypothetical protein